MTSTVFDPAKDSIAVRDIAVKSVETFVVRHELAKEEQFEYSQSGYKDRTLLL